MEKTAKDRAFFILVALSALDTTFTMIAVHRYGMSVEANPLMHWVFVHYGEGGFAGTKLVSIVPLAAVRERIPEWAYGLLIAVYALVVFLGALNVAT